MKLLIKNGRVIDPANNRDAVSDVLIQNGKISRVEASISGSADKVIEAADKIVIPGLIDMHVHLREPGREDKETIASGTKAALKGGVTTLLAMPNTQPPIDNQESARLLKSIIKKEAQMNVLLSGAITRERLGEQLSDIENLAREGVVAVSDDGSSVDSPELMRRALKKAQAAGILVICHCEDKALSKGGLVNLGFTSTRLGLRGISKESEYQRIARDIALAQEENAKVHITHVSCKESVQIIAQAKKKGVAVTADTAPHYFSLDEQALLEFDTYMKINPPLRGKDDVESLKQALKEGTLDAIASDHAPHTDNEKDIEFERAAFGATGLETELAVAATELIEEGLLSWPELIAKVALNPARILGINKGTLSVGTDADLAIVSPREEWTVGKEDLVSKSKNSCFLGKTLRGVVEYTIYQGKTAYTR